MSRANGAFVGLATGQTGLMVYNLGHGRITIAAFQAAVTMFSVLMVIINSCKSSTHTDHIVMVGPPPEFLAGRFEPDHEENNDVDGPTGPYL